jgi:lysophospholipase L1-like esterase
VSGKAGGVVYEEGRDFVVDYGKGTISRTADSRIPDYSTHVLYDLKDFDHTKFTDWGNHKFFVWADYETTNGKAWAQPNDQSQYLASVRRKLEAGGPFKIASYGDSITAGGEASEEQFRFQQRYAQHLRTLFPKAEITVQDVSISGYSSQQGIDWFDKYLGTVEKPDLVLVGFGMNDHNIGGPEPAEFERRIVALVELIRERKGADVILFSAFPPNENWHYGTHRMGEFATATKQAAAEAKCAYVDVFSTCQMVLARKDQSSLLGNNINHPNDFGHWLYEQAFEAVEF